MKMKCGQVFGTVGTVEAVEQGTEDVKLSCRRVSLAAEPGVLWRP